MGIPCACGNEGRLEVRCIIVRPEEVLTVDPGGFNARNGGAEARALWAAGCYPLERPTLCSPHQQRPRCLSALDATGGRQGGAEI